MRKHPECDQLALALADAATTERRREIERIKAAHEAALKAGARR